MRVLLIAFLLSSPTVSNSAELFCGTGTEHPVDVQFEREMEKSNGVTVAMLEANSNAYKRWDAELNLVYGSLLASVAEEEKASLRAAQRAWLAFRDAEEKFWWTESISDGGTLAPVIVGGRAIGLVRDRVCQLTEYKRVVAREPAPGIKSTKPGDGEKADLAETGAPSGSARPQGVDLQRQYVIEILGAIDARWDTSKVPERVKCQLTLIQIPGGEVISVEFGSCPYDSVARGSVERALRKGPLPYAGFESVFRRNITLHFCHPRNEC